METRLIIALCLIAVIVVFTIWGVVTYTRRRREFAIRQAGRGKNSDSFGSQ